jgi:hypothetical protein
MAQHLAPEAERRGQRPGIGQLHREQQLARLRVPSRHAPTRIAAPRQTEKVHVCGGRHKRNDVGGGALGQPDLAVRVDSHAVRAAAFRRDRNAGAPVRHRSGRRVERVGPYLLLARVDVEPPQRNQTPCAREGLG